MVAIDLAIKYRVKALSSFNKPGTSPILLHSDCLFLTVGGSGSLTHTSISNPILVNTKARRNTHEYPIAVGSSPIK
jgi:hypothetical protein